MCGLVACATLLVASPLSTRVMATSLSFVGSHLDIGGTFFPGGTAPYVVVPWRSETNVKPLDIDGNNVYGSAGYALFATKKTYPDGSTCCGGSVAFNDNSTYPNMIDLPSFVASSLNLTNNKVGGWPYALIDDPELVNGYRDYNWGMNQVPPRPGPDQSPYVMMGILDGNDIFGNDPKNSPNGAGRWAFSIGAGAPNRIRVGVITDGLNDSVWAATEVLLHQVTGRNTIVAAGTTETLPYGNIQAPPNYVPGINRMVDIHMFDIVGAQPGDTFAIFAKGPATGQGLGAISGVTFDYVPEPGSALLAMFGMALCGLVRRRRH